MSAITDALRRASSAAKTTSATDAQAPPPLPPMPVPSSPSGQYQQHPATPPPELPPVIGAESSYSEFTVQPQRRSALPFLFALLVILLVFGAGASFLYARKNGPVLGKMNALSKFESDSADEEEEPENEVRPATPPASGATAAATTTTPAPAPTPAPVQPTVAAATPPPAARPAVALPAAVATTPAAPVRFPALKLQSIYYKPANPSVMINGKTLFVTDEISGVTVADITPSSVTL